MPQLTRHAEPVNAWAAYRRLLEWAEHQGLGRRPAESTGQLQARLVQHAPAMADTVSLVTSTYEVARYGEVDPPQDRMHHMQAAVEKLDVRS